MEERGHQSFDAEYIAKMETVRRLVRESSSNGMKESLKLAARGLYGVSRVVLGTFIHPVATFKAWMLIGDREEIRRNFAHSMSIPGFKGSERFTL